MTTFFTDNFAGTGTIVGHAPDTGFSPAVWRNSIGGGMELNSGFIRRDAAFGGATARAQLGFDGTNYGAPLDSTLSFSFVTSASLGTGQPVSIEIVVGGVYYLAVLYLSGASWFLDLSSNGSAGVSANVTSALAATSTYAGTFRVASGTATLVLLGQTLTEVATAANAIGLDEIRLELQAGYSFGPMSASDTAPGATSDAALIAPMALLKGYGGASAALTAPKQTISATGHADGSVAFLVAPMPTLKIYAGGSAALSSTVGVIEAYGGGSAALVAPSPVLFFVGHDSAGDNAARLAAPMPTLKAYGGGCAALVAPKQTLTATGTGTNFGHAALVAPTPKLVASGLGGGIGNAALTLHTPYSLVGYGGAVCSITLTGSPTIVATGTTGGVGSAALSCPLYELVASGSQPNHGSAALVAPMAQLSAGVGNFAWLVAPMATLTAIGTAVVAVSYEAYSVNLTHKPRAPGQEPPVDEVTRYTNFPFTHIVRYRNSYFGAAADGLYLLEGTTDAGTAIPYAVKTCIDDFGAPEKKTIDAAYFGGRLGPGATVTLTAGELGTETYAFTTPRGQLAQGHRQKFGKGVKNRYFAVGVAGTDVLEIDNLELVTNKLTRKI